MKRNLDFPRSTLLGMALAAAALWTSSPAGAANLVNNGSFNFDLSGWNKAEGVSWWNQGVSGPGSARLGGNPGIVGTDVMSQCVAVQAGAEYDLLASALVPSNNWAMGGAALRVVWHDQPRCTSTPIGVSASLDFSFFAPADWTRRVLSRQVAPGGSLSASIWVVAYTGGSPDMFAVLLDDVEFSLSPRYETRTIPTASSVDGAWGERFQTSLSIRNPSFEGRRVDLSLFCKPGDLCGTSRYSLLLGGGETLVFPDVMQDVFGKRNAAGTIEITYDASLGPIVIAAKAATVHQQRPGNGMALPVVSTATARKRGLFTGFVDPRGGSQGVRVNVGAYNPTDSPVTVEFFVMDEGGQAGTTVSRTWGPREWFQINDVFSQAQAGTARPESYIRFASQTPVLPFLLVIDNRSGDPTWIDPKEDLLP